jgi:hypothetical protein
MRFVKGFFVLVLGVFSALYLLNVGAGVVELIPDVVPFFGNFDEAAATFLLLNCLTYFGVNIGPLRKLLPADQRLRTEQPDSLPDRK